MVLGSKPHDNLLIGWSVDTGRLVAAAVGERDVETRKCGGRWGSLVTGLDVSGDGWKEEAV